MLGSRLKRAREDAEIRQIDLAHKVGYVSERAISDIEVGRNSIDPFTLLKIARLFGLSVEWFLDPAFEPRVATRPSNRIEWEAMYPDDPNRARIHWEIDQRMDSLR